MWRHFPCFPVGFRVPRLRYNENRNLGGMGDPREVWGTQPRSEPAGLGALPTGSPGKEMVRIWPSCSWGLLSPAPMCRLRRGIHIRSSSPWGRSGSQASLDSVTLGSLSPSVTVPACSPGHHPFIRVPVFCPMPPFCEQPEGWLESVLLTCPSIPHSGSTPGQSFVYSRSCSPTCPYFMDGKTKAWGGGGKSVSAQGQLGRKPQFCLTLQPFLRPPPNLQVCG